MEGGKKPNNYVLIVVGRMGHGKSSFCRMLVSQQDKGKIKVQTSTKSVTLQCELYETNFFYDILGDKCWIMDTPGLDSKSSIHLVVEDIDDMILEKKLNVIGIAYVVDIHQRDQNQEGESYIFTFLETLRLKHCYKHNLSFCILSKFDKHYECEQDNEVIFAQLKQQFQKHHFPNTWNSHILWCSQPCKDIKHFQKKIKGDCSTIYSNQFIQLRERLHNSTDNNTYLNFKDYISHRQKFQKDVVSSMLQNYKSFEFSNVKIELKTKIPILDQARNGEIDLKQYYREVPISRIALLAVCTPLLIGLSALIKLTAGFKVRSWFAENQQAIKKELDARMQQKMRICLLSLIGTSSTFSGNQLIYSKNPVIDEVECYDFLNQRIKMKDDGKHLKALLKEGSNTVIFRCRPPSRESWKKFIELKSRQYFTQNKQ